MHLFKKKKERKKVKGQCTLWYAGVHLQSSLPGRAQRFSSLGAGGKTKTASSAMCSMFSARYHLDHKYFIVQFLCV